MPTCGLFGRLSVSKAKTKQIYRFITNKNKTQRVLLRIIFPKQKLNESNNSINEINLGIDVLKIIYIKKNKKKHLLPVEKFGGASSSSSSDSFESSTNGLTENEIIKLKVLV